MSKQNDHNVEGERTGAADTSDIERTSDIDTEADHISVSGLRKTFDSGSVVACDDINIEIDGDEFVVLVGPSGCGKTTTLRCIAGLETPDEGEISIDEEEITDKRPKDRDLAFVFQSIALFPHMSVRRNIRFGLDMNTDMESEEKNQRVEEVAEILGIEAMLDRQPSALSGGQQQRVSLGRAMVMEPAAFLLDEPFSALDANLRDQMRVEVKKLQRNLNTAMIFVTHDQEEAMTLGDSIIVMNEGHIQQKGSPHEIYNEPQSEFVARFIGSPSPNFFVSNVENQDGAVWLTNEVFSVKATEEQRHALSEYSGEQVTYGIRPEYLDLESAETDFEAHIDVIEPLGDRDAIHMSANEESISALTQQGTLPDSTTTVNVSLDRNESWLFTADGDRLV